MTSGTMALGGGAGSIQPLGSSALRAVLYIVGIVATTAGLHAGVLFLAGLARAGGWLAVGRPRPLQRALLAVELAAPPAIVAWQARLAVRR